MQSLGGHLGGFTLPRPRLPFASSSRPFPPRRCRSTEKQPLSIPKRLKCPAGGCAQPPAKCPSLHSSLGTAASRGPLPSRVSPHPGRDGPGRAGAADHLLGMPLSACPGHAGAVTAGESRGSVALPALSSAGAPQPRGGSSSAAALWARGDAPEEGIWRGCGRGRKTAGGF